jgi:lipopolysaccharide/colanic/teichoic acid biosynthesis glycosyltransferase
MTVFPILLDLRPAYTLGTRVGSLLLLPYGPVTLLRQISDQMAQALGRRPLVVRSFDADLEYESALCREGAATTPSLKTTEFTVQGAAYEPSDRLLIVDPRVLPAEGLDLSAFLEGYAGDPGIVRHLVALQGNPGGTNERIECDSEGRVRRVQRYYDSVTWTVTTGVACSLVPVSSLQMAGGVSLGSLIELRRELASQAVPSRDYPLRGTVFDLTVERGLLNLNEHRLHALGLDAQRPTAARISMRSAESAGRAARLIGPVVLHPGVSIAEDVTVIGPSVIGTNARLERGSVVAQSVVGAGAVVPAGFVLRHRVATDSAALTSATDDQERPSRVAGNRADSPMLREEGRRPSIYPTIKAVVEAMIAAAALLVLSPLLLIIAVLIKLESRGPVFFGDPRESKNGELFRCFKFRTMKVGSDVAQRDLMAANQVDGPQFKIAGDPRVTRVGHWLRQISLDELPQLINVVRGEMSLIGPRPSPFRENQTCVPWRDARLSVRPGITGLWQVCRHEREAGDFHQWIYYDMQYVRHMSFWLDVKILFATLWTLGGKGHVPFSWMISSSEVGVSSTKEYV